MNNWPAVELALKAHPHSPVDAFTGVVPDAQKPKPNHNHKE